MNNLQAKFRAKNATLLLMLQNTSTLFPRYTSLENVLLRNVVYEDLIVPLSILLLYIIDSDFLNFKADNPEHCQAFLTPSAGKNKPTLNEIVGRKLAFNNDFVMLQASTVWIINYVTAKSTLACFLYDTAFQATLISKSLKEKLGLDKPTKSCLLF